MVAILQDGSMTSLLKERALHTTDTIAGAVDPAFPLTTFVPFNVPTSCNSHLSDRTDSIPYNTTTSTTAAADKSSVEALVQPSLLMQMH